MLAELILRVDFFHLFFTGIGGPIYCEQGTVACIDRDATGSGRNAYTHTHAHIECLIITGHEQANLFSIAIVAAREHTPQLPILTYTLRTLDYNISAQR